MAVCEWSSASHRHNSFVIRIVASYQEANKTRLYRFLRSYYSPLALGGVHEGADDAGMKLIVFCAPNGGIVSSPFTRAKCFFAIPIRSVWSR